MNLANLLKIALKALNNNKLRCFLTMLGIIIGVASVITMLAIGQGSKNSIKAQISEMGSNMIMIHPGNMQRGGVRQSADNMQTLEVSDYEALKELPGEPTVFIVSQRASSIQYADSIIVMDDGEIAGIGTHDMLLETCGVYREIYDSQFKKEGRVS